MGLTNITLVIHDWGSPLGFQYLKEHDSNVNGLAFMEAILHPIPSWDDFSAEFKDTSPGLPDS